MKIINGKNMNETGYIMNIIKSDNNTDMLLIYTDFNSRDIKVK